MSLQIQLKKSAVSQKQPFASDLAVGELALNYNAAGPFLTCKDTAGNVRKLNNVWVSNSAPTNPSAGDLWLDTTATLAVLKVYKDATATWVDAVSVPVATTSIFGKVQLASAADITNATAGKVVDAAQLQSKITAELSANPITLQGVNVVNNVTIGGDLTVNGTQTTINTQTLDVEDKNIVIGNVTTPSDATADGGGISLLGATTKSINWVDATDSWTSSENVDLASGKSYRINGTEVLSATALGSAVQITSANIPAGTIVDSDINASAEIAVSKLADGAARQLLQTDAAGTGVEWTDNVDIPGTLDVTGAATFDSSVAVTGALTKSGNNVVTVGDTETVTNNMIAGPVATDKGGTGQTTYTDGQLLIGKTDGTLAKATLTAGANVTITNADGGITVASDPGVTSVTGTSPIASTGGATPDISIQDGTTTQKGAVQLEDSTSSTSTTTAATPNAVKSAYDLANAALPKAGGTMTGDITFAGTQTFPGALTSSDIGVTVQAYDADTAKYDDTTANFTGTLQNNGSNVLVDTDIGSTIQAYDADTAKLDTAQTFTAAQRGSVTALTPGATVTPDFSVSNNFSLALNQNTTLANPTNITAGQSGAITITQDSTARTLAYGTYWYFQGGAPTLGTTTGAVSTLVYYVDTATRITAALLNEPTN